MKKIISLLSVFAMIATLFTTVAFADANNKFYIEETVDGTNVTLTFYLTTNKTLGSASGALNLTDAYANCDAVASNATNTSVVFNANATQKVLSWTLTSVEGATGVVELGKLELTNVKADFTLPVKRAFTAKDSGKVNVVADFTNEQADYAVKAPVTGPALVENDYVFSFTADEETDIKITHSGTGDRTYDLPNFVEGAMEVWGLLKIKDSADIKAGDTFTIQTVKNREVTGTVKIIEVK